MPHGHPKRQHPRAPPACRQSPRRLRGELLRPPQGRGCQPGRAARHAAIFQVGSAQKGAKSKAEIPSAAQFLKKHAWKAERPCSFCTWFVRLADCRNTSRRRSRNFSNAYSKMLSGFSRRAFSGEEEADRLLAAAEEPR